MCCPVASLFRSTLGCLTYESEDLTSPCPLRLDGRKPENAFRRLVNLRAETHKPCLRLLLIVCACSRTGSPSLHSCSASGGASSFLLASALPYFFATKSCDFTTGKTRDASDRLLPPVRNCVHPHLACSRLRCRDFRRVGTSRSLGFERLDRGTERFHDARNASADRP